MSKTWPPKDPDEVLDYGFDWSPRSIDGDPITETEATLLNPDDCSVVIDRHVPGHVDGVPTGYGTITWLSGGAIGEEAQILLRATTGLGRILDQSVKIKIKER